MLFVLTRANEAADLALPRDGAVQRHEVDLTQSAWLDQIEDQRRHRSLLQEFLEKDWFAILVTTQPQHSLVPVERFATAQDLWDFLAEHEALVETWFYPDERSASAQRVSALDWAQWERAEREPPVFLTASYRDGDLVRTHKIAFGFRAAERALAERTSYARHRELQNAAHQLLSARNAQGELSPAAQEQALQRALQDGLSLRETPRSGTALLVAAEFKVDPFGNYVSLERFYSADDIDRALVREAENQKLPVIYLRAEGGRLLQQARAFRLNARFQLEPEPNPILGQDTIELRLVNPLDANVARWNALEFGEPELVRQAALARFSLINAHLEKGRKRLALKKSKLDLVAEPIIAGLNIGGGVAGLGFPAGDAVRLAYNLITPKFIADVPSAKQMKELFATLAAKNLDPQLRAKPSEFLTERDIAELRARGRQLTDAEVELYLRQASDSDVDAMLRLARMAMWDARITNFLNILTSAGKVSGVTDRTVLRDLFNSPYFSLNGDVSMKTLLAVAIGQRGATSFSGVSLEQLADGQGPAKAWLQFFDVSLDLRALVNSLARLRHREFAEKELSKPFPYATKLSDLAAYEVRIFGFPLLLFYKRGLIKADAAAYERDYAYAIDGPKVVEHFATQADLDREIRAGRMAPIGYVRVPDPHGWKESNLAVFAHRWRQPNGREKLVLVLYGLAAYREHSDLIERELDRFRQFEEARRSGAVIERVLSSHGPAQLDSRAHEASIYTGPAAGPERFTPLLARLLELRRVARRLELQLPLTDSDRALAEQIRAEFLEQGFTTSPGDPIRSLDRHHSSFQFERVRQGQTELVQCVHLPSLAQVERALEKARAASEVESLRRDVAQGHASGVLLIHEALAAGDQPVVGPLREFTRIDATDSSGVLHRVRALPVVDRARLEARHYAATWLPQFGAQPGPVFVTVEFPAVERFSQTSVNPFTGQAERVEFQLGERIRTITRDRIVEHERDAFGEVATRTFANLGSLETPQTGDLLDETRTVEHWLRRADQPLLDPALPVLRRIHLDHVRGELRSETFGLFSEPVRTATALEIVENRFSPEGQLVHAMAFENGADPRLIVPGQTPVDPPMAGLARFETRAEAIPWEQISASGFTQTLVRRDLIKGTEKTLVIDLAHEGRLRSERSTETVNGRLIASLSTFEYDPAVHAGRIPTRTRSAGADGAFLFESTLQRYDPRTGSSVAQQRDYTGQLQTHTWQRPWENPVSIESAHRRTRVQFNRSETEYTSETIALSTGELVRSEAGRFDPDTRVWHLDRVQYYRPGLPSQIEQLTLTPSGRVSESIVGKMFSVLPSYDAAGRIIGQTTFALDPASGQRGPAHRSDDQFVWSDGALQARAQIYYDGAVYDSFQFVHDALGRLVTTGTRLWPDLELETVIEYDADSLRPRRARELQHGQVRVTREYGAPFRRTDNSYELPVQVSPAWGLAKTEYYRLGDPRSRPTRALFENGDRVEVLAWFGHLPVARIAQITNRHGQLTRRYETELNAGTPNGLPCDRTRQFVFSPWGTQGLAEERWTARGTDVAVLSASSEERTFFDLRHVYPSPAFVQATAPNRGIPLRVRNRVHPQVLRFASTQVLPADDFEPERLLFDEIDLVSSFSHQVRRRVLDRAGNLREERIASLLPPTANEWSDVLCRQLIASARPTKKLVYRYDRGWWVPTNQLAPAYVFTSASPSRTNDALPWNDGPWLDGPTEILVFRANSEQQLDSPAAEIFLQERSHSPQLWLRNPYLPGLTNVWKLWHNTLLNPQQQPLYHSQILYDAAGREVASRTLKRRASDEPAIKMVFHTGARPDSAMPPQEIPSGRSTLPLTLPALSDWTDSDFVYFFLESSTNITFSVLLTDQTGGTAALDAASDALWAPSAHNVMWLPDHLAPSYAAAIVSPDTAPHRTVVVLCVPALTDSALDLRRIQSAALLVESRQSQELRASPLFLTARGGLSIPPSRGQQFSYRPKHQHGSLVRYELNAPFPEQRYAGHGKPSFLAWDNQPFALLRESRRPGQFPDLLFLDASGSETPRPLYALAAESGSFLQHYKVDARGDADVYTVVHGFELPKREQFRAEILADELSPSVSSYGYDYHVRLKKNSGESLLARPLTRLRARIAANPFTYAGERVVSLFRGSDAPGTLPSRFSYPLLHNAKLQAREIERLPTVAERLVTVRTEPWLERIPTPASTRPETNAPPRRLALELLRAHVRSYPLPETQLIPTAPDTSAERFVDTVAEADLIQLAVHLGEHSLAAGLLDFYWAASNAGHNPVHDTYDARSGTALAADLRYERPIQARRSARAQLAIAEAAFALGFKIEDHRWIHFGRTLLTRVLEEFRPPAVAGEPRGIAEYRTRPVLRRSGVTFWPEGERYSTGTNARACLLLRRLHAFLASGADSVWRYHVREALAEEERWLRERILPHVQSTGVVPAGLFQIQDINDETTALGPERWTSADDWMLFLAAAQPWTEAAQRRVWLANLARVHGVEIRGTWGLDCSIPLIRPPLLSANATARFSATAALLGEPAAALFAHDQLQRLQEGLFYPAWSSAAPAEPVLSGQGSFLLPRLHQPTWPLTLQPHAILFTNQWNRPAARPLNSPPPLFTRSIEPRTDLVLFIYGAGLFYLSIFCTALFWWCFRSLRRAPSAPGSPEALLPSQVVSHSTMRRAEQRWAQRILGMQIPRGAEHTRFSNSTVEQNFLMQLRALYKLVLEWRRGENGWSEDDPRLAEDASDRWLNGIDEFASVIGLYMRWVIKAGVKDGFSQENALAENEDSNHIWSRLVMFLSEPYWAMLSLLKNYQNLVAPDHRARVSQEIVRLLGTLGVRQRLHPFDARVLFNYPANPEAFDLLWVQKPGMTLERLWREASDRLLVPYGTLAGLVQRFKEFKRRERPDPIHPYLIEAGKVLPHFVLMGLGALVCYNQQLGDRPLVPYLWSVASDLVLSSRAWWWLGPLFGSLVLGLLAHFTRIYRFSGSLLRGERPQLFLDATLTSFFTRGDTPTPQMKAGRWWKPQAYESSSWVLRAFGFGWLAIALFQLETPSFATFMVVKGILAMLAAGEVAGIVLPVASAAFSKFLQDRTAQSESPGRLLTFFNRLNITATRPASPLWLSFRYHTQASVPSGTNGALAQAVLFYFAFAALFLFVGIYLCQSILSLWFTDTYLRASNVKLFIGSLVFWNTMYLLRYGLFLLVTGLTSFLATFPLKSIALLALLSQAALSLFAERWDLDASDQLNLSLGLLGFALPLVLFETEIIGLLRRLTQRRSSRSAALRTARLAAFKTDPAATLGIVYMSGDDLSFLKLTPDLLMSRWSILRDRLDSRALPLAAPAALVADDAMVRADFTLLYDLERKAQSTLWHPAQLVPPGTAPELDPSLDLNIPVTDPSEKMRLCRAWHLRRWLVTMMSTAGHSQDTAINLIDIALRLAADGLAAHTAFYLIQNKYDNGDQNRPVQSNYQEGELAHRNKLARLLEALAPGARAYSLQNWTPFGFKAGGLTGMDLVPEEILNLRTMVVLDRNANIHDLDAFMSDLTDALTDPELIIVIPGRGTTNTLTPLGQASQLVEEGHRSFLKGLMAFLGGGASEAVGTGWGNVLAVFYGRTQSAMLDRKTLKMPLTSRMQRGSSFAAKVEGLIGFAPHAVGISEDTWAVSQAAHNAIALGGRVKFALSRAFWHKIREAWSHSEWLASFPRWSGGFVQMMHDPIMQRINDFGPLSVFAKEVRANSGRNFLSAPFALCNILVMPLAIMFDFTPFVQILIVLWFFGFIMNQVLTIHGLNTYLESAGFYRSTALAGAVLAGAAALWVPEAVSWAPAAVLAGMLTGGFIVGLGRWLSTRVRDILVFGPQLVLHSLGQIMRQTMEFTVSGASPDDAKAVNVAFRTWVGPREDRPLDRYAHWINLRTIVWIVGVTSVVLNMIALSTLDMLNVLLLVPSLLFSVSTLIGPFIMKPKIGRPIGLWILLPKLLGWTAALVFYTAASLWLSASGWVSWLGILALGSVFAALLHQGARYLTFNWKLSLLRRRLLALLHQITPDWTECSAFANQLIATAALTPAQVPARIERSALPEAARRDVLDFSERRLTPHLRQPFNDVHAAAATRSRWASEFQRSFLLALFVLIWFFIVPVPGLFIFTADEYKISIKLGAILALLGGMCLFILVADWLGRLTQVIDRAGISNGGLTRRILSAFSQFQSLLAGPRPPAARDTSHLFALFTDVLTYTDQRSYAYVRRVLLQIEARLRQLSP